MKKWLLVLGMITCMLGASACSKQEAATDVEPFMPESEAIAGSVQYIESIDMICKQKMQADFEGDPMISGALANWTTAQADIGNYEKVIESSAEIGEEEGIVYLLVKGSERNANVEIMLNSDPMVTSVTVNPIYTFAEMMEKAALNTLLGMGTVFVILILISLIISCFSLIPKWQAKRSSAANKVSAADHAAPEVKAAVDHTIAQIIEKEELADDLELAAVIAAAIAASQGAASVDGFVVRSIRKARRAN